MRARLGRKPVVVVSAMGKTTNRLLAIANAAVASDREGALKQLEELKAYTLAEGGQGAHISLLTGRATAAKQSLSASKTYMLESDYVFQPRVFTELQHAQAVAMPYDGLNPLPPQYCYLKPHYLDVQTSYFEHGARGTL